MTSSGHMVHLSLCFNPSHLEFVGPVVLGRARAKQERAADLAGSRVLPIVIHGDAAFAGQGVVQEMFNLSALPGYSTGGAIHVVLNNQIGFTTPPSQGRSSQYATDVARMLQIPIFHVNGERAEAVDRVIRLAMEFRTVYHVDVVIDMYCYRRHGHNERDDPTFTQPLLYEAVCKRKPMRVTCTENLLKLGAVTEREANEIATQSDDKLVRELEEARRRVPKVLTFEPWGGRWSRYHGGSIQNRSEVSTAVSKDEIVNLLMKITELPEGFIPHARVARLSAARRAMARDKRPIDWGAAEALAFATLLMSGCPIRLSGQDSERGTFGHRHAVLHDAKTGRKHLPLQHLTEHQAQFTVVNSPLSEVGVLGFEFGYSLDYPDGLVIWEAQFGDFCNVAQVIVDQFIVASEEKWQQLTGLTMFLPHGLEGQGPEHSSARLERFLQLVAKDNIQVVSLSTAGQLFHCLRRQVLSPLRKPLIIMSPKSLLQHPIAGVAMSELTEGSFQHVLGDGADVDPRSVKRIILCTGKIYYDLTKARAKGKRADIAIARLEQFYPFPGDRLSELLAGYPEQTPLVWVQEEPENMGAWPFLRFRLGDLLKDQGERSLLHVTRPESVSPAVGSKAVHDMEQEHLIVRALAA